MLAGQFDRDALVMCRRVEAAAFRAAAVIDRFAAEKRRKPLQCHVVSRIDETITARRSRYVTAVKRRHRQPCKRLHDETAQLVLTDILVKHPKKMAYSGCAVIF